MQPRVVAALACAALVWVGCATVNPLLPDDLGERGMLEASLSLQNPFSFDGARLGSTSIQHLWRSGLERGVQHVHVSLTTPTGAWLVECVQEARIEGSILQSVNQQGRVCRATPAGADGPAWALALVGRGSDPWEGYLVDPTSAWALTGFGLNSVERVSPVLHVHDQGRLIGVWDEIALMPRLWTEPSLELDRRQRLEVLGLLMFALDDLRDGVPSEGVTYNALDAQPVVPATQPPSAAQLTALAPLADRLKAQGFPEGAELLERQTERARVERLDTQGPRLVEQTGPLGRPVIELKLGPLFGAGLGWEAPDAYPSGLGLHMGAGIRLTERTQLILEMGMDLGPYSNHTLGEQSGAERGWSNAGFSFGLGARGSIPLLGPVELTLGALARGRLASGEAALRGPDGASLDGVGFIQAGFGLAPLVGLQHATSWNDLGTRTILFLEFAPEWTSWSYGRLDLYEGDDPRILRIRDTLAPLLEDDTFLLRAMFGARLEL